MIGLHLIIKVDVESNLDIINAYITLLHRYLVFAPSSLIFNSHFQTILQLVCVISKGKERDSGRNSLRWLSQVLKLTDSECKYTMQVSCVLVAFLMNSLYFLFVRCPSYWWIHPIVWITVVALPVVYISSFWSSWFPRLPCSRGHACTLAKVLKS